MGSKLTTLAAAATAAVLMFGMAPAKAWIVLGTEDPSGGFVGNILASSFPGTSYLAASDGEAYFDPFGAGYDTSDGLNLSGVPFQWNKVGKAWNQIGFQTWVLPANLTSIGCGVENEPTCEPVGKFISPSAWNPLALGTYVILDNDGPGVGGINGLSDLIHLYNDANGNAHLDFFSDPAAIPESSTWAMMLLGFAGLGFAGYRARKPTAALAV